MNSWLNFVVVTKAAALATFTVVTIISFDCHVKTWYSMYTLI